jgi:hypothetical protein
VHVDRRRDFDQSLPPLQFNPIQNLGGGEMAAFFKSGFIGDKWIQWHVGEPIPPDIRESVVVTVQADGHELDALFQGLENYKYPSISYSNQFYRGGE